RPLAVELLRQAVRQPREARAYAVPAGQVRAALRPGEDPRDGPQLLQLAPAAAAGRARAHVQAAYLVDRCNGPEEVDEAVGFHQGPVLLPARLGHLFRRFAVARRQLAALAGVARRGDDEGVHDLLEVPVGEVGVGVAVRERLALLGHAH